MSNRIISLITSRYNSARLPHKALLDIGGKPVLQHIVDAVNKSKYIEFPVIATTKDSVPIIEFCKKSGIHYHIGKELDIADRIYKASKAFQANTIVRIWGDSPLISTEFIDSAFRKYRELDLGDLHYFYCLQYETSYIISVMRFPLIEWVWLNDKEDREDVHNWLIRNGVCVIKHIIGKNKGHLLLDNPEDYVIIKRVYERGR